MLKGVQKYNNKMLLNNLWKSSCNKVFSLNSKENVRLGPTSDVLKVYSKKTKSSSMSFALGTMSKTS